MEKQDSSCLRAPATADGRLNAHSKLGGPRARAHASAGVGVCWLDASGCVCDCDLEKSRSLAMFAGRGHESGQIFPQAEQQGLQRSFGPEPRFESVMLKCHSLGKP